MISTEPDFEDVRLELVLLEDNAEQLHCIQENLTAHGFIVHSCSCGEQALEKILSNPYINMLITDIEILDAKNKATGMQGYDVVNHLAKECPNRLISVMVMTALKIEDALYQTNYFKVRVENRAKDALLKIRCDDQNNETILKIVSMIEAASASWIDAVKKSYPKSKWLKEYNNNTSYWKLYQQMWYDKCWIMIEEEIGEKARAIMNSYDNGDTRKLRGGFLRFKDEPVGEEFKEILIGRRVIYAMKLREPTWWKSLIRGERSEEEEEDPIRATWDVIKSQELRDTINEWQDKTYRLADLKQKMVKLEKEIDRLEKIKPENLQQVDCAELEIKQNKYSLFNQKIASEKRNLSPIREKLERQILGESEFVQKKFIPLLRSLGTDFTVIQLPMASRRQSGGGSDPLTQVLLILGIREDDIAEEDYHNWKLLLPEEITWLERVDSM